MYYLLKLKVEHIKSLKKDSEIYLKIRLKRVRKHIKSILTSKLQ